MEVVVVDVGLEATGVTLIVTGTVALPSIVLSALGKGALIVNLA